MPTKPIPFMPLNLSVDKTGQTTFNQSQKDGYWQEYPSPDGMKFIWHKRPGLSLFKNLGENSPVDGLTYWTRQNLVIPVCNGKVFKLESDATQTDITGTASMLPLNRPTFADVSGSSLYIASGGKIGAFSTSTGAYLTDPQAPTVVRFLATINQVLVALRASSEQFDWADAGAPTSWTGLNATNETLPDLSNAFKVANAYLYFWGQESLEVWRDDGQTFVKEGQGAIQRGNIAPYSVTEVKGTFYWLDDTREIVSMKGFGIQVVSNPALTRYIRSFSTVADAKGDYLRLSGRHFYILSFPTEEKTLVFDIALGQWYEWSYWNSVTAEHEQFLANSITEAPVWNKTLVGDRRTGKIYEISDTLTTDNGDTIRTVLRTDFIDQQAPDNWKRCSKLVLVFKRADTNTTPKKMLVRWRDEGSTDWTASQEVELEAQGHTELKAELRRCGRYKRRQWEFIISDATQAALLSATETFDYGR